MLATTKRGLTWAVRMLAHSVGVNVVEDPKAATFQMRRDGVFVCPVMNEEDPVFADLINGAGIHEIAHFLESDFQILDQCSPVERSFMMIFEDLRIERWAQFRWKGAASEMKRMWNALYKLDRVSRPDVDSEDILYCVGAWALAECRALALQLPQAIEDAPVARNLVEAKFGPDAVGHVDAILASVNSMLTTADALSLTRRLLSAFVDPSCMQGGGPQLQQSPEHGGDSASGEPQPATGMPAPSQGPVQSGGGPTSDAGSGDADGTSASEAPGEPEAGEGASADDERGVNTPGGDDGDCAGPASASAAAGDPAIDVPSFVPVSFDGGDLAEDAVSIVIRQSSGGGLGASMEVAEEAADSEVMGPGEALVAVAQEGSLALRERIRHLLLAASMEAVTMGRRGRLKPTALWKVRTGNPNVFRQVTEGVSLSTDLWLLCDASSSMKGRPLAIALQAAAAVCLALEGIPQVKTAISAFPNGELAVARLKKATESVQAASDRVAGQRANGGTPLRQALVAISPEIKSSSADRKILLVPTDGEPDDKPGARAEIERLERLGVEVVQIHIGGKGAQLAKHGFRISSVADLADGLFGYLQARFSDVIREAA